MLKAKVAVTLDADLLAELDRWVAEGAFPNRSQAVSAALRESLERRRKGRLARACALLDPAAEVAEAEWGLAEDVRSWPEY